jgi:putative phage-type endonuclease
MIIHDMIQGAPEWFEIRRGKFTASEFGDLFMGKTTKGYNSLINRVVYERMTGEIAESFSNGWTERGTALEPEAREAYELQTFNKVHQIGFMELDEWVGCSTDGLIGESGIVSIKCPKYSTLIDYHLSGKIPVEYLWQIYGELWISKREWCDFYVWHPKMKPLLRRVERDEKAIDSLGAELSVAVDRAKERMLAMAA